ncbi:hypothetical protein BSKO_12098 [Bryopsis sp. KO-2023]|nr:hypothetical protein BSKO_12098 [Bryopsis sp. KO-2023]
MRCLKSKFTNNKAHGSGGATAVKNSSKTTFLLVALMALGYAGVMFSDSQLPQATKDRFLGGVVLFGLMAVLLVWLLSHEDLVKIRMRVRA